MSVRNSVMPVSGCRGGFKPAPTTLCRYDDGELFSLKELLGGNFMPRKPKQDKVEEFERALADTGAKMYTLRLFVSGASQKSLQAIDNLKRLCEDNFPDQYELEVVDIYQQPGIAAKEQLLAVPTLIKELPLPVRRLIGNLSNSKDTLKHLGVSGEERER
jgi:circadian clock protein KaiB